jgi:plastocyanin
MCYWIPTRANVSLVLLTVAAACGGDGPAGPEPASLNGLSVTPAAATLYSVAPDRTVQLFYQATDQRGQPLSGALVAAFSSNAEHVAQVDPSGLVTAVAVGTATITTTVTMNGVAKSAHTAVTVVEAAETAIVTAPERTFLPGIVHVRAGGRVTWRIDSVPHDVVFNTEGAPEDIPRTTQASVSRVFPVNGIFLYECTLHANMTAAVHVH